MASVLSFSIGKSHTMLLMWHFTRHVVVGVLLFIIVGLAAVILKYFNDWLIAIGMPSVITKTTHFLELGVFVVDVISFTFLLFAEVYSLCREIYEDIRNPKID